MVYEGTRGRPRGFCDVLIGYARVSAVDQDPALQLAALEAAGVERLYTDRLPGNAAERPGSNTPSTRCARATPRSAGGWTAWAARSSICCSSPTTCADATWSCTP